VLVVAASEVQLILANFGGLVVVVVVVGRRRKRVDARLLSLCHTHSLFIHSFVHSFMVILFLIIVKRREEKRREERRGERIASLKEEVDSFIIF